MFKKINGEDKSQKINKIYSKFSQIKNTVTSLKKVSLFIYIFYIIFIFIEQRNSFVFIK